MPPDRKDGARARLADAISQLGGGEIPIAVRVNRGNDGGNKDIAAVGADAGIIVLPKASPATTARAATLAGHAVPLVPLIEDPRGVIEALAIAEAAPPVAGLGFGVEDHATAMGAPPTPDLPLPAEFLVIQAARAAGPAKHDCGPSGLATLRSRRGQGPRVGCHRRFRVSPGPGRCPEPELCTGTRGTGNRPAHCRSGRARAPRWAGSGRSGRKNDRRAH